MKVSRSIAALSAALVHPGAMEPGLEPARRDVFMPRTLAAIFATLGVAPFFLAFHGAPSPSEAFLFLVCLTPLAAVMLVSATGRPVLGHLICVGCLLAAAATLALSREASVGGAIAWLIVAQTESLLSFDRRLVIGTAVASCVVLAIVVVARMLAPLSLAPGQAGDWIAALALLPAIVNAMCMLDLRHRARVRAEASTSREAAIAAAVGDLVVSHDRDGAVDFIGRDCERQLGLSGQDLMGRGLFEHIHVADRPIFLKAIADAAEGTDTVAATFRLRAKAEPRRDGGFDPVFIWIDMRARRLARTGDRPFGVVSLLRDVSAARRAEAEHDAALRTAETARQSRDHFLANMSHELRTPLNAIIGFSEMLGNPELRPSDPAKQFDYARIIHQSGQHLLAVVNSILDMSKIQSGTFSIQPERFEIGPLIGSCCDMVTLKAMEGRVEIVRHDSAALEPVVGDRRACKQILINLLSNAVKFTPEGGRVTIAARPDGNSLLVSVSDTGIGIGAADLSRLGDPFFQAKAAFDRPYEGTGLGLSVVRGLVGLHGGTIAIESEPGHGTSVAIRLPLDCRVVTAGKDSATIETFPRRQITDRIPFPTRDLKVKKSA